MTITRDYTQIDKYLTQILGDVYQQPEDAGHSNLAQEVINLWMSRLDVSGKSILDVGCGQGFCQPMFENFGMAYTGIAIGEDVIVAKGNNRNVLQMDFNFLKFEDESFDLVFSRHSLEHSVMPLITLMEWNRVSRNWLGLVVPAPEHYTFEGQNHYSVMTLPQITAILPKAGWHTIWYDVKKKEGTDTPIEYWVFCEKIRRKIT